MDDGIDISSFGSAFRTVMTANTPMVHVDRTIATTGTYQWVWPNSWGTTDTVHFVINSPIGQIIPKEVPVSLASAIDLAVIAPTEEETTAILDRWAGDPRITKVYDQLLAGKKLIDVRKAVSFTGHEDRQNNLRSSFQNCAPLTVAPLGAKEVNARRSGHSIVISSEAMREGAMGFGSLKTKRPTTLSMQYVPDCRQHVGNIDASAVATTIVIPEIPTGLIDPTVDPNDYLTFFEAHWTEPTPIPSDPALLKRVSGFIYEVVAVWDLTPLEAAALG